MCIFQLHDNPCIRILRFHQNIRESISGLSVRSDRPIRFAFQNANQNAMIEYFFFLIPYLCIQHADCFPKEHRQFLFYILYFSFQKSTVDFLCRRLVICNNPVKPLPDLKDKNFQDFFIWNHQLIHSIFRLTKPCEISSCEQYTPHIFCAVINLIISQIQPDSLLDSLSCNQLLDFILGGRISDTISL